MPKLGKRSKEKLATCDKKLQEVLEAAIEIMDFTVLCGHRGQEEQDEYYATGRSKVKFPNSNHNEYPSKAVDIAPWPIDWDDKEKFHELAGVIKAVAHQKGVKIKWGGEFKNFFDGPHIELDEDE